MHPLLRILRPVLAPTAAADVVAGVAFAGGAEPLRVGAAVAGSLCLYGGGMALNDVCDRARDAELHPDRPLVTRPELTKAAGLLAAGLLAAGVGLCAAAGALWTGLAVAVLATAYDLGLKERFPADVLTLGGARTANLATGLVVGGAAATGAVFTYGAAYLVFIGALTAASRAEDMDPPPTRRLALLLAFAASLVAIGGLALATPRDARALVLLVPAALQAVAFAAAMRSGTREGAMAYVFRSLLLIFVVHTAVLFAAGATGGLIGIFACAGATCLLLAVTSPRPTPEPTPP